MDEALEIVAENIRKYRTMQNFNGEELLTILQQIVGTLHYLETERAKCYRRWTSTCLALINSGEKIGKAEKMADERVPELYMLRHIMKSGYENVGAIRTTLTNLRSEKQTA